MQGSEMPWAGRRMQKPASSRNGFSPPPAPRAAPPTPLMVAFTRGSAQEVKRVLQADPEAATRHFDDYIFSLPLCWAAERKLLTAEIASLLLAHGANPNEENSYGRSVLALLCAKPDQFPDREHRYQQAKARAELVPRALSDPPIVQILQFAEEQAPEEESEMKAPPKLLEIVKRLLICGADPCKPDLSGDTPLSLAAAARCTSLVGLLRHACLAQARVAFTASPSAAVATRAPYNMDWSKDNLKLKSLRTDLVEIVLGFC